MRYAPVSPQIVRAASTTSASLTRWSAARNLVHLDLAAARRNQVRHLGARLHGARDEEPTYSWGFVPCEFHKVEYAPAYPAIDFFRSLGSVSQMNLNHFWYLGEDGRFSACQATALADESARNEYWRTFEASALFKTVDWAHEEEYRVLLHSGFDLREKPMRTLRYNFGGLAGIIFGAKTDTEDRLRILRIIDQKCSAARRSAFEFLEIRYVPEKAAFVVAPLSLLKFKYEADVEGR